MEGCCYQSSGVSWSMLKAGSKRVLRPPIIVHLCLALSVSQHAGGWEVSPKAHLAWFPASAYGLRELPRHRRGNCSLMLLGRWCHGQPHWQLHTSNVEWGKRRKPSDYMGHVDMNIGCLRTTGMERWIEDQMFYHAPPPALPYKYVPSYVGPCSWNYGNLGNTWNFAQKVEKV